MDSQLTPSFPTMLLLIISFMFLAIAKIAQFRKSTTGFPPGPLKLPIIGNMLHFIKSQPHHTLRDLAYKYGPVMHLKLGQVSTIVISSPEAAKLVMKTHDATFADRPFNLSADILLYGSIDIGFSPHGEYWRQLRKISITELLGPKRVHSFRSIREDEVSSVVRSISSSAGSVINLSRLMFAYTFRVVSRAAFGEKSRYENEILPCVNEALKLFGGFSAADLFPSFKLLHTVTGLRSRVEKVHQTLDGILESIMDEHRTKQESEIEKDLMDVLLDLQKNGDHKFPLSNETIKALIMDLYIAGTETSSATLEWAMSEMLKNPRVMEKAQAEVRSIFGKRGYADENALHELKYLKLVIKETLRLYPPAPLIPRQSTQTCEILGHKIPERTRIIVNTWTIGRDPRHWSEADRFYPERFIDGSIDYKGNNFEYIPFGAGRRMCPGVSFALVNIELLLAQFLYHFDWNLPNRRNLDELDMTECFGMTMRRKNDLYLIPTTIQPWPAV